MTYKFHIKIPIWVYIFIFAFAFLMLWMALTGDEIQEHIAGYISFAVLVGVGTCLFFLQIGKKGGIELNDKSLIIHNIPLKKILLEQIYDVEVGYNGNKKNMRVLYYEKNKIKSVQFGQAYSESLSNIAELIRSQTRKLSKEFNFPKSDNNEGIVKDYNRGRSMILNWALPSNYILLSMLVYFVDFFKLKILIYVIFGFLFLLEIALSFIYYRGNIKITKRILISFLLFSSVAIFLIVEMLLKLR